MTLLTPTRLGWLVCLFALTTAQAQPASKAIEGVEFRGLTHVTQEMMSAATLTKVGDVYSDEALRRDFTALWKTGRFADIQIKTEPGAHGGVIVSFVVLERPQQLASNVIEELEFRGARGVPADTLKAAIRSKVGDVFDEEALRRDVTALRNIDGFEDVQLKTEMGSRGGVIVRFVVTQRP